MTKETLQRVYLFLLLCFGLLIAGVAFYRVKAEAQAENRVSTQVSLQIVRDVQAEKLVQEAGKSGTIGL